MEGIGGGVTLGTGGIVGTVVGMGGVTVGIPVGPGGGVTVGIPVGPGGGVTVGIPVGPGGGVTLGMPVGPGDGVTLGMPVGPGDGVTLGSPVGPGVWLGTLVGAHVGDGNGPGFGVTPRADAGTATTNILKSIKTDIHFFISSPPISDKSLCPSASLKKSAIALRKIHFYRLDF